MRRPGSPGRSSTQQADLKLWPLPTQSPGYGVSVVNNPPLKGREWAGAILVAGLLAAVFLGGALTGRVLSPAAWLFSQAPWSGIAPPTDLGPGNGLLSDSVLQFEPWLAYAAQRLHAGALPLWQPANMLGAPFIGNMQSAVFDPLNWPYMLWPDPMMLAMRAWLKLVVAALGTYGLARAVLRVGPVPAALAAISFAFSTFLTVWLLYPLTGAVVWLPWLWWATARLITQPGPRSVAVLAGFAALPLLAGQPEMALHLALATGTWALFCAIRCGGGQRGLTGLGLWAGGYALGTLLAAIQVLPFLEYLSQSAAWQARAGAQPDLWLPPYLAWTLVSPLLFGTPIHSDWWDMWTNYNEAANYVGLLPLLLLPFALRERAQRALALFLIGGALLAAGVAYHLPLIFDAWTSLPLLRTAANQRLIVFVQFALALLGALGLDAVAGGARMETRRLKSRLPLRSPPTRAETEETGRTGETERVGKRLPLGRSDARVVIGVWGWAGVLLALGVGVPLAAAAFFHLPAVGEARITWAAGLGRAGWGLAAGAALLAVVALGRQERQGRGLALLVPLAALADLWSVGRGYNPTLPAAAYFPPTAVTAFLQAQPGPARSVATGWILPPNTNVAYGVADLRGYDAVTPQTYYDILRALDPTLPARAGGGFRPLTTVATPLLDLLNGRYLLAAPGAMPNERPDVQQDGAHDEVVGEISGPYRVGQTFVAGADGLTAVQVAGATFGHPATGRLRFHLRSDPTAPSDLATVTVDAATLGDNVDWTFRFPPIRQSQGRAFYFYFDAPAVAEAQAVTVYYTKGNHYRAGSRMQDERPAGGDLVFRTIVALDSDQPPFTRVLDGGPDGTSVYLNRNAQPRAWLVHHIETVAAPAARVRRLADPTFDRAGTALLAASLPTDQPLTLPPAAGTDMVTILRYTPETVDLATRSATASLLVLADQAFPGWSATVDGQAATILTADHALRGVYLPAGAHTVRFSYAPPVFLLGAGLTLIALLIVGLLGSKRSPAPKARDR